VTAATQLLDLRRYRLQPGESRDVIVPVDCESVTLGGLEYTSPTSVVDATLRLQPTGDGLYMRLRFACELNGPCQRCLEPATVNVKVDATEYHQHVREGDDADNEELVSDYLHDNQLDVATWAREAMVLAVPSKILCREDCAGLCPACGANRNDDPGHDCGADVTDSRWAKLRDLEL
jgi:uncharacterized protein